MAIAWHLLVSLTSSEIPLQYPDLEKNSLSGISPVFHKTRYSQLSLIRNSFNKNSPLTTHKILPDILLKVPFFHNEYSHATNFKAKKYGKMAIHQAEIQEMHDSGVKNYFKT